MKKILFFFLLMKSAALFAQQEPVTFHTITTADGLNDGWVNAICQDKYGYMWFASAGALNRYNGRTIRRFTYDRKDSTSPPASVCNTMAKGVDGRLWLSFWNEMAEFDYSSFSFRKIKKAEGFNVNTIIPVAADRLILVSRSGLRCYNPLADRFEELSNDAASNQLLKTAKAYSGFLKNDELYIGVNGGYIVYNSKTKTASFREVKELRGKAIDKITVTTSDDVWIGSHEEFRLLRIDGITGKTEVLDHLLIKDQGTVKSLVNGMIEDESHTIWIATNLNSLLCYNPATKNLVHHNYNPSDKNSVLSNMLFSIFVGNDKKIWLGYDVGVNYVNQQKNVFSIGYPFGQNNPHALTRGMEEDHEGNLWFTTGNGISMYNVKTGKYSSWQNQPGKPDAIYFNSVRAIAEDANHDIWVPTGKGVNRLNRSTGKMDFLNIKDSIPEAFYFSLNKTSDGTLWFGTRDYDGLYYYKPSEKKFHGIAGHPVLGKYKGYAVRYTFEDSKKRLWFGYNGSGLLMYDPATGKTKYWNSTDKTEQTITSNVIVSINEDRDGKIWVSTFNGISCIDLEKNECTSYTDKNGLPSNIVGGIAVDDSNRVWFGTAAGLVMLEKSRRYFTLIGAEAGLPITDFTEHAALKLRNGKIIMPSRRGYVLFDPLQYKADSSVANCFIADVRINGDQQIPMRLINNNQLLQLNYNENFFSIDLEAVSFNDQLWYAYRLDGLEKEWHYTQNPKVVYTNLSGGNYTFRYKASSNINNWNGEEKTLHIHIATIFYKTWWFRTITLLLIAATIFLFYRFRMNKQKQILNLETKAESLEKEKTLVQYESLKQHLNPHFLFNSLTSLRSLIKTDAKTATSFLDGMSKVYRYVLKSGEQELVRLQDELEFVETFVKLQKIRFKEGLDVHVKVPDAHFNKYIAPVTLQNLVENAIKHNTADKDSPLLINIFIEDDYVIVRNNLQLYRIVETSNKKGLASLQTLYRYYSDKPVVINEDEHFFTVKIPLL
ncbi:hypothetical protein ESA94_08650 [Lacibacter luteus]|uniref:Histidine kinase n=1 Tax=Lacibacter luteus TaxID=2508719 RepID=A0A4Q1CJI1_9BACT|nr:sensor histidine kinase [Lacibacter luteus]RXK60528.1 hypothetical protein ESA94_08650 [Lacibacter luteus]